MTRSHETIPGSADVEQLETVQPDTKGWIGYWRKFSAFWRNETGNTAIEYGLLAAGIGIALILVFAAIGDELVDIFQIIETNMENRANQ